MDRLKEIILEHFTNIALLALIAILLCTFTYLQGQKTLHNYLKIHPQVIIQDINFPADFMGTYTLTAYCPCRKCVGRKLIVRTATGTKPQINRTIAVDPTVIPYGSIVYIEGLGYYIAEDCGGSIKGNSIDIFVANHTEAINFGKQTRNVWIMKKEKQL